MAKANIWTYTKDDYRKVRIFAEVNNLATFERSIRDYTNNNHEMLEFKGGKNNLRVVAAYAYALEQIEKQLNHSFLDTDIID